MAYQPRPPYNNPSLQEPQHRPLPWAHQHRGSGQEPLPMMRPPSPGLIDPESEDSDVSAAEDDLSAFALPIGLPPAPSKSSLESQQFISMRLEELERHENHNIKKHNRLRDKRKRMDDRIARKRAKQDEMIKAIMTSRGRRDSRIKARRDREDIAYQRFYEDVEEEENRLRQRLKRMKRGLPVEDNPTPSRRPSFPSPASPLATSYSTVPPPAKRRRTSQPSYPESPATRPPDLVQHHLPPVDRQPYPYHPQHHGPPPPSTPYSNQGHHPVYHPPSLQSPKNNHSRPPPDLGPYPPNGYHNSPHAAPAAPLPPTSTPTQGARPPMSTYDTRPPPPPVAPASSGFAAVNQPPHSGFAAVNARHVETPPSANVQPMNDSLHKQSSTPNDETPVRPGLGEEKVSSGSGSAANKRTPSTTHPYQMSEAFANRHHHCERTDSINRGIWTWYGLGGTQDRPTAPPTQMYLKCNHDNCGRIDWRTVHGLQCHIVKNHEQPKGTIGSLEKALAAYGVPVRDIEEIEKRDGLGSGGTMADPKNGGKSASRNKGRDTPVSTGIPPSMNKQRSSNSDSPTTLANHRIEPDKRPFTLAEHRIDGSVTSPIDVDKPMQSRPTGFAAVNGGWANMNQKLNPAPSQIGREHFSRESGTPDRPALSASAESRSPPAPPSFWSGWQPKPISSSPKVQAPSDSSGRQLEPQQHSHLGATTIAAPEHTHKPSTMLSLEREAEENKSARPEVAVADPVSNTEKLNQTESDERRKKTAIDDITMEDAPLPTKTEGTPKKEEFRPTSTEGEQNSAKTAELSEVTITEEKAKSDPVSKSIPDDANLASDVHIEHRRPETSTRDINVSIIEEAKTPPSPEVIVKRVLSRRESRRASIATAASSKLGTDKGKDDEREAGHSRAATENTVDEDDDTIRVNSASSKTDQKESDRIKDEDRNQTPPKRLANGRFTRRSLR